MTAHPGASFAWLIEAHSWGDEKHSVKRHAYLRVRKLRATFYRRDKSLVQPLLDYCDVAWSPGALKQVDKLERVQKLAARIVLGAPSTARTVELYKTLNWSTLDQHRRYHTATYVFKVLNGLSPPYLQNIHLNYLYIRLNVACVIATAFT